MDWQSLIVVIISAIVASLVSLYYKSKYENLLEDIARAQSLLMEEQETTTWLQSQIEKLCYEKAMAKNNQDMKNIPCDRILKIEAELGQIVYRVKKGMSQAQIAEEVGLSKTAVNTRCKRYNINTIGKEKAKPAQ